MSALFFRQLGLNEPQHNLGIGSGTHGVQTARILEAVEEVLLDTSVDAIIVYGDTNSTLAGALAAAKLHIPIAHVEAGLRSFNRRMPEEINRVLTDHASDLLFVPTKAAIDNLRREGIADEKVHMVGDVMYDAALAFKPVYSEMVAHQLEAEKLQPRDYFVATVHRAENTDDAEVLRGIVGAFNQIAEALAPIVWPVHPRTRKKMQELELLPASRLRLLEPIGYLEMQAYLSGTRGVFTDSGGLQKEAAFQRVPTLTLRAETEWPETVEAGCNVLVGTVPASIVAAAAQCHGTTPPCSAFGKGNAAALIAQTLQGYASR